MKWIAAGAALLLLAACADNEEGEKNIEGTLNSISVRDTLLPVFVGDNLSEEDYQNFHEDATIADDYEAEMYRVMVTEDTAIFIGDDEVEIEAELSYPVSDFFRIFMQQEVSARVNTVEEFEEEVMTDIDYLVHQRPDFTPIYTAEEIYLGAMDMDLIVDGYQEYLADWDEAYSILAFADLPYSQANIDDVRGEFEDYHYTGEGFLLVDVYFNTEAGMFEDEVDAFPYYMFLNDSRVILETSDADELHQMLEEEGFEEMRSIN
ncbi:hypothetical protein [Alteribacter natronophilus]|uniref:hypothetical protein n=1 Tax=Alteribacter natronophilus TaxID=2583810 RepID=UPI00110F1C40|nr:hypothetical protein [Alteribacter natronophilus]TMW70526.1 hypothetical protein FGB90_15150 [Alteribacter natronophilus]